MNLDHLGSLLELLRKSGVKTCQIDHNPERVTAAEGYLVTSLEFFPPGLEDHAKAQPAGPIALLPGETPEQALRRQIEASLF